MRNILFICLLFLCIACKENKSVDPTIMPEKTTVGANTFGCLVDGWLYVSGRWGEPTAEYVKMVSNNMTVSAQVGFDSFLRFTVPEPKEGETYSSVNIQFRNLDFEDGEVHILRMSDGVFSGTFESKRVKNGRFDLVYNE